MMLGCDAVSNELVILKMAWLVGTLVQVASPNCQQRHTLRGISCWDTLGLGDAA
jgi:hypothetical protein